MSYRGGSLTDLVPPLERGVRRYGRKVVEEVGSDLKRRVRRHTPVSKPGAPEIVASYGSSGAWIRARGGRRSGTLKDSWQLGDVDVLVRGGGVAALRFSIEVFTLDPVAPHVEYPTRPHVIRPRKPGGRLTIPTRGGMVLRREVHHPGTQGAYMMAKALAEVAATWQATARRLWEAEARSIWTEGVTR